MRNFALYFIKFRIPVNQRVICCTVILDLVHPDVGDVSLGRPANDCRRSCYVNHHHSPVLAFGVVGLGGGGDVGETRALPHVSRIVDEERQRHHADLHGSSDHPSSIGRHAGEGSVVLERGDEDLQRAVVMHDRARVVMDQLAVGEAPVNGRLGVAHGLTLKRHALALHHVRVGDGVTRDEWWLTDELLLRDGPEILVHEVFGRSAGLQVILSCQPAQPEQFAVAMQRVAAETHCQSRGVGVLGIGHDLSVLKKVVRWQLLQTVGCHVQADQLGQQREGARLDVVDEVVVERERVDVGHAANGVPRESA